MTSQVSGASARCPTPQVVPSPENGRHALRPAPQETQTQRCATGEHSEARLSQTLLQYIGCLVFQATPALAFRASPPSSRLQPPASR